mmetsp:Transcript_88376/g.156705  ORF Transcript_88376/g.156705 Transcript_88376/m.156705 type:complete len:231 (-) Transcript_88376:120-812(-)
MSGFGGPSPYSGASAHRGGDGELAINCSMFIGQSSVAAATLSATSSWSRRSRLAFTARTKLGISSFWGGRRRDESAWSVSWISWTFVSLTTGAEPELTTRGPLRRLYLRGLVGRGLLGLRCMKPRGADVGTGPPCLPRLGLLRYIPSPMLLPLAPVPFLQLAAVALGEAIRRRVPTCARVGDNWDCCKPSRSAADGTSSEGTFHCSTVPSCQKDSKSSPGSNAKPVEGSA